MSECYDILTFLSEVSPDYFFFAGGASKFFTGCVLDSFICF